MKRYIFKWHASTGGGGRAAIATRNARQAWALLKALISSRYGWAPGSLNRVGSIHLDRIDLM